MKKLISIVLAMLMMCSFTACGEEAPLPEPEFTQMKNISELAVMECYYHNVAKYYDDVESKFKFQNKFKHFWIEYEGIVKYGIDAELVEITAEGDVVTITIPKAKVLSAEINAEKLNKDCYIVDKDSEEITSADEKAAFENAQKEFLENCAKDEVILSNAQQRAQILLEEYVKNVGELFEKNYTIEWVYLDADGLPINQAKPTTDNSVTE